MIGHPETKIVAIATKTPFVSMHDMQKIMQHNNKYSYVNT